MFSAGVLLPKETLKYVNSFKSRESKSQLGILITQKDFIYHCKDVIPLKVEQLVSNLERYKYRKRETLANNVNVRGV